MEKKIYRYRSQALAGAKLCAAINDGKVSERLILIDDKTKDVDEDLEFSLMVGLWSGEAQAFEVLDERGERIGVFAFWSSEEPEGRCVIIRDADSAKELRLSDEDYADLRSGDKDIDDFLTEEEMESLNSPSVIFC